MTKTNTLTAAEILRRMDSEQIDLFYEGLEGYPHDVAVEMARRSRLAVERGYVTATEEGVFILTDAGRALTD